MTSNSLPGLTIDMTGSTKTIKSSSAAFSKTRFRHFSFEFEYRVLTRTEQIRLEKSCTTIKKGVETVDKAKQNKKTFIEKIVNWKGLKDSKGAEIPYNEDNKEFLAENMYSLCNLVCIAIDNEETGVLDAILADENNEYEIPESEKEVTEKN